MLMFGIYFLIGYGIALIFRKDIQEVTSKRKYLVSLASGFLVLVLFTGYVSPRTAGMYSAAVMMGSLSAFGSSYEFIKKLRSKYVHIWIIPLLLILIEIISGAAKNYLIQSNNETVAGKDSVSDWSIVHEKYKVNLAIDYQFTDVGNFSYNGLAPVMIGGEIKDDYYVNGRWGYIDKTGKFVINPVFNDAHEFSDSGYAWVKIVEKGIQKYGLIDGLGNFKFKKKLDDVNKFSRNGYAIVSLNGKDGVINLDGEFIIPPTYKSLSGSYIYSGKNPFDKHIPNDGIIIANNGSAYGYINIAGQYVIKPQFNQASSFSENGLAAVLTGAVYDYEQNRWIGGKWGFINKMGNFVITPQFDDVLEFKGKTNPLAPAMVGTEEGGKWGYINSFGKFLINPIYDQAFLFNDSGVATVTIDQVWSGTYKVGGKSGIINKDGKYIIEPSFINAFVARPGKDFLLWLRNDDGYFLADNHGVNISEITYNDVRECSNNLCSVKKDGKWGYITILSKD